MLFAWVKGFQVAFCIQVCHNVIYSITQRTVIVIKSFAHSGLEKFFKTGSKSGIQAAHAPKLRRILAVLDELSDISELNGLWKCHQLKGKRSNETALWVSGNWRITFELNNGNVYIVNYEDYH